MALPVSQSFLDAQAADVNQIAEQVLLVLGNYASSPGYGSTVAASSEDASGNYPATGAIDGDRTEINIGAAAGADNNVGKSSWKSGVSPATTPQTLTITFSQSRTINRVKLYHLIANQIASYLLSYWNGSAWIPFAGTADQIGAIDGYGEGGYGSGGYGGTATLGVVEDPGPLDVIDFSDITSNQIQLTIYRMDNNAPTNMAEVVELECYRKLDITSRTKSVKVSRQRDYKIANPMAATVDMDVINDDRFFSYSHTPTDAEAADGFVNSELQPGVGVIVKLGFSYGGGQVEYPQVFTGTIDRITVKPHSRDATIQCRDSMKGLINRSTTSRLKTSLDIYQCIQYLLNLCNISTSETALDVTTIVIDFFFTINESVLTTIQNLVAACGDAVFYFDENGIATFKYYGQTTLHFHTDTSTADFNLGTTTNVTTEANELRRDFFLVDNFQDGDFTHNPTWNIQAGNGANQGVWSVVGNTLQWFSKSNSSPVKGVIRTKTTPAAGAYGTWSVKIQFPDGNVNGKAYFYFVAGNSPGTPPFSTLGQGYAVGVTQQGGSGHLTLYIVDSFGALTQLGGVQNIGIGTTIHTLTITRDAGAGEMDIYWDGGLLESVSDNTWTTSSYIGCAGDESSSPTVGLKVQFSNIYYSLAKTTATPTSVKSIFQSGTIDQSVNVSQENNFDALVLTPAGSSINFFTRTSPDGVTWSPWAALNIGDQIPSPVNRYLQYQAIFNCPIDDGLHNANITTPIIYSVTLYWTTLSGTPKYPPNVSWVFSFDSTLLDVEQEIADNLGGDTAIINDVIVQAQPLILQGANTDEQWKGTTGVPAQPISGSNPLSVVPGNYNFPVVLSTGMDISRMSGANPAAVSITFSAGAAGTWSITQIHPTLPIIQVVVTVAGQITNITLNGKTYQSDNTLLQQQDQNAQSINLYGDRQQQISNEWIINQLIALQIAQRIIQNASSPNSYIPSAAVRATFAAQINDRVTVEDVNLDLSADYVIVGIDHQIQASEGETASAATQLTLLKVLTA